MKTISEILKKKNGTVEFEAFLDTVRDKKWVMFVILKDATGEIQLTVDKGIEEQVKFVDIINSFNRILLEVFYMFIFKSNESHAHIKGGKQ